MIERRKRRSRIPHRALSLYLADAARRSGAHAAALANSDGLLLAGAGAIDLDRLAALGATAAERADEDRILDPLIDALTDGGDLYASRLTVAGATCYLTSIGARLRRQRAVAADVARILAG